MKKKILINASMLTEKPTGGGVYSAELLKKLFPKLHEQKIDFVVYCYHTNGLAKYTDSNCIRKISLGKFFDIVFLRFQSLHRLLWNFFVLDKIAKDYSVIYALSTYGSLFNPKQIVTVHDLIGLKFPKQHKFQYLYFKYLVPIILKNSEKIIAISNFTAKEIIRNYPTINVAKIEVIKNGVDHITDHSNPISDNLVDQISNKNKFCLMIGASYRHKNLETVLKVAQLLHSKPIRFIVAGRSSAYYDHMIKEAQKRQLTNVSFIQYVDEAMLSSLYKKASLHLYISLYEGFGFPPAEAAYFGTQSIVANQTALAEVYTTYFPTVDPLNETSIAKLIEQNYYLTKNNTVFSAIKTVYSWEATASKIFALLVFKHL